MDEIIIRQYKEEDKQQILDLLNRNFREQQHIKTVRDINWWEWKYENNPFGKPIIYIAEHENKIIAFRTFWPWNLNIRGKDLRSYQPLDSVVDKEFRGRGLFTKLTMKILNEYKSTIDLIFNFPNEQSIGAYSKLGWSFVGKLEWYVKIKKVYSSFKLINSNSSFTSLMLDKEDFINQNKVNQAHSRFFNYDNKIKTLRTKEFLTWRYMHHPQINYGMKIIKSNKKQLVYIFEINENEFGRELIILDYFGDMNLFNLLLKEIDLLTVKYNVSFVSLLNKFNTPTKPLIKKMYIKQKRKNFVTLPLNIEMEIIATDYKSWDIFLGMHDSV